LVRDRDEPRDDDEEHERDDEEVDDASKKVAVLDSDDELRVGVRAQHVLRLAPIATRQREPDDGHDDVRDERRDDLAEGTANHDTNREIERVSLEGECPEVRDKRHGALHFPSRTSLHP